MNKNKGDIEDNSTPVPYLLSRISAGFPSPADDYIENNLSLSELLIRNHLSTFLMKTSGDSMMDAGINDGDILKKSIYDLSGFYKKTQKTVLSVAIVPVGLTKFRPKEDGLIAINQKYALQIIDQVETIQREMQKKIGTRFCWLSDEWYLIAGKELPQYKTYEDMPQESNGVGTIRSFLNMLDIKTKSLPKRIKQERSVSWVVGKLVYEALIPTKNKLNEIIGLNINLYGLPSIYWGQEQVVTGLLTGEDLIIGLKDKDLGEAIFIPSMMLKINTDLFLDDKNISEVEKALATEIHVVDDANDIIKNLIGIKTAKRFANHV